MAVPLEQFTQQLVAAGLFSETDMAALLASLPEPCKASGEQFVRELVRQKKLTVYQAQVVHQGRGKSLFLGNYVILDKLGQGGMGLVLKAEHRRMKRLVALKVLSPAVTKTAGALQRFQREVEAAARLEHPNIVTAYDADEAQGIHFLVMQYVEGSDLSALVKQKGPLSIEHAVSCITQAARGLEFAHTHGVIHRDIKPANLLLDTSGTVKILDMGLARIDSIGGDKAAFAATQAELTSAGTVLGTVDYIAPEQAENTKTADARADLYSLGMTLWYLLNGRPAYEGDSLMSRLLAHRDQPIPSLKAARPGVPESLDRIFRKLVAKRPADRYQSAAAVIAELEACRVGTPVPQLVDVSGSAMDEFQDFMKFIAREADAKRNVPSATSALAMSVPAFDSFAETLNTSRAAGSQRSHSRTSVPWSRQLRTWMGGGVAALCLLLAVIFLAKTPNGTLRVEILDPDVEVKVQGTTVTLNEADTEPVTLSVGEKKLTVTRGKLSFETDSFVLKRGEETKVKVELLDDKLLATSAGIILGEKSVSKPKSRLTPSSTARAIDPHRRAAEMVLKQGGTVAIVGAPPLHLITRLEDLPENKPFGVLVIRLNGRPIPDAAMQELAGLHYVEICDFSGTNISKNGLQHVRDLVPMVIDLARTAITDDTFRQFAEGKDFREVSLGGMPISDTACQHLRPHSQLRSLNLAGTIVGDAGLKDLAEMPSLRHLNLPKAGTAAGLIALQKLPNLQTLDLGGTELGNEVVEVLAGFKNLRLIHRLNGRLSDDAARQLQQALPNTFIQHPAAIPSAAEASALRWAVANGGKAHGYYADGFESKELVEVPSTPFLIHSLTMPDDAKLTGAENLRGLHAISSLTWPKNADAAADSIATLTSLHTFDSRDLTEQGLAKLTTLKQMEQLHLYHCPISDEGFRHLSAFEYLFQLGLSGTPIGDAGLAHVGQVKSVWNLELSGCANLTSAGLKHLIGLPRLRHLVLAATAIDDTAVPHLAQMTSLRILYLEGTKVTAAGIADLKQALPKCCLFWDGGAVIPGTSTPANSAPSQP